MHEAELHNLIMENKNIQANLLSLLKIETDYIFVHEDKFPNGLYADFTILKENVVRGIIECKGSDIGVNDFVRGIGQIVEYQHFADNNLSIKGYNFQNAITVYCFPSTIIKNKNFNLGLFGYPENCKLVEFNEQNYNVREITRNELKIFAEAVNTNKVTISPYYIRDNRLFELYICLKFLQTRKLCGVNYVDRKQAEEKFLRKIETPNNRNWRNAFISLSSVGFIDSNNIPTAIGAQYADMEYEEFAYEIYRCYIKEYLDLMINVVLKKGEKIVDISYTEMSNIINQEYNNKQVLFVTDSDNRYLSSWMNILRDDYGAISFESRKNIRTINYRINELNEISLKAKIRKHSKAYEYIKKFYQIISM